MKEAAPAMEDLLTRGNAGFVFMHQRCTVHRLWNFGPALELCTQLMSWSMMTPLFASQVRTAGQLMSCHRIPVGLRLIAERILQQWITAKELVLLVAAQAIKQWSFSFKNCQGSAVASMQIRFSPVCLLTLERPEC